MNIILESKKCQLKAVDFVPFEEKIVNKIHIRRRDIWAVQSG